MCYMYRFINLWQLALTGGESQVYIYIYIYIYVQAYTVFTSNIYYNVVKEHFSGGPVTQQYSLNWPSAIPLCS